MTDFPNSRKQQLCGFPNSQTSWQGLYFSKQAHPRVQMPLYPIFSHIFRHNRNLQNCFKFCQRHIALCPAPFPLFWDSLHYNMGHTRSFPTYLLFLKSWPWFAIDSKYFWHSVNLAFEITLNYRVTKYSLFSENSGPCANSGVYSSRLSYVCWHLS